MLFNSFQFVVFFVLVTTLYFLIPHRFRWALLLAASCLFYMAFVPVYILILAFTIGVDYLAGLAIERSSSQRRKKAILTISILSLCVVLFVFKYFNFFNANVAAIATFMGWHYPIEALRIILPIGLSFHTFQSLSYVVEVYRGRQKAERHFGIYSLYVMYFPQLVAGPIERPQNMLHQFHERISFNLSRIQSGLTLALWGLFKKVVVADSLAIYVDSIYNNSVHHSNASLLLATYCFAFQIYCDFSGYSDMARGISRVYGIELMQNFESPYFSRSVQEFWSRWHISLSSWFRDYVYFPLGGSRVPLLRGLVNVFVVFLLSGLWHGANWTYIVWGGLHGSYLVIERLRRDWRERRGHARESNAGWLAQGASIFITFNLVAFAWVFFRANNLSQALDIARSIVVPTGPIFWDPILAQCGMGIACVVVCDILIRKMRYFDNLQSFPIVARWSYALALLFGIALFGIESGSQFIYFQF